MVKYYSILQSDRTPSSPRDYSIVKVDWLVSEYIN